MVLLVFIFHELFSYVMYVNFCSLFLYVMFMRYVTSVESVLQAWFYYYYY